MLKSFSSRAIAPVALSLTGFVVVCILVLYSSFKRDLIRDTVEQETSCAKIVISATRYSMMRDDREALYHIISSIGAQKRVEHLRIFNKKGVVKFSSDPRELNHVVDKTKAGCVECHSGPKPKVRLGSMQLARRFVNAKGHSVLAITAPIYNDASCSASGCHVPPSQQKLLGTLDIGMSTKTLDNRLRVLRWKMTVFCIMFLILSVGGVSALLKRNLLAPLDQLMDYVKGVSAGNLSDDFPRGVSEIEAFGRIYLDMARKKHLAEAELIKIRGNGNISNKEDV